MVEDFDKLQELLKTNDITLADVEFIVRFMVSEKISPQLAMRRIKSIEQLKEKLEADDSNEQINELEGQLKEKQQYIAKLEEEKSELASKTELLDSEREELQKQLQMLQEMQIIDEDEEEETQMVKTLNNFIQDLEKVIEIKEELTMVLLPVHDHLTTILAEPEKYEFEPEKYIETLEDFQLIETEKKEDKLEIETDAKIETKSTTQKSASEKSMQDKKINGDKLDQIEPEDKTKDVLNLFLDFIEEAETDKSFKERVSTICDMDEAYEYLGSIGLSQVYSFSSKGIDKKNELIKLLQSWKKEGVPR